MQISIVPPTPQPVDLLTGFEGGAADGVFDVPGENREEHRHGDDHGYLLLLDLSNDFGRIDSSHEDDFEWDHRRDEGGHDLSEEVTQREQIQDSKRLKRIR